MIVVIHQSGRSWDDSACDDNIDFKTQRSCDDLTRDGYRDL